jgi:hypothetical protein
MQLESGILGSILGSIRPHSEDLTHSLAFMEVERIILPMKQEVAMTLEETSNPCVETGVQKFVDHSNVLSSITEHSITNNFQVAMDAKGGYSTTLFSEEAVEIVKNHDISKPLYL